MSKAIVKTRKSISPVWILPIIALLIGGWLVAKSAREAGFEIVLRMEDAAGITAGKTQVLYKGLPVGMVKRLSVSSDLLYVNTIVEMKKESRPHITEDTRFWVVRPEVSMSQISGLETLVSGSYIGIIPGESKALSSEFIALDDPPALLENAPGLHLTLQTPASSTHEQGAPVLFKRVQVGEVLGTTLGEDTMIRVKILVYKQHAQLVSTASRFWDVSGIQLKANLSDISLKIGTFKSMFAGGVQFETPPGGKTVPPDHAFTLHKGARDARHADDVKITLHMPAHHGVNLGAPITYRNVNIGTVHTVTLAKDMQALVAVAGVSKESAALLRKGSYIWVVTPEIGVAGIKNIDSLIKGAYLKLEPGDGKPSRTFTVYEQPPVRMNETTGLNLVLECETLGSLKTNRPVYYRQVKVGKVTGAELAADRKKVYVYINIYEQFVDLVSDDTRFWNVSGLRIQGGLMSKIKIASESFESLIAGGIALATPETEAKGRPVKEDRHFVLHKEMDEKWREWLAWDSDIVINFEEKEEAP